MTQAYSLVNQPKTSFSLNRLLRLAEQRYALTLALLVVLSAAARLFYLSRISDAALTGEPFIDNDSRSYYEPALTLAQSFTYHSYTRTPGYPAFLALIYRTTGDYVALAPHNIRTIFVVQILLLALSCLPLALAVRRLTESRATSLAVTALWAFHNAAGYASVRLLTEALAATLMCLLVYCLVRAEQSHQPHWFLAEGLVLIALSLLRPSFSLMPIPLALAQLFTWWRVRARTPKSDGFILLACVLLLPMLTPAAWALRNRLTEGQSYYSRLSTFNFWAYAIEGAIDAHQGRQPAFKSYHQELIALLPQTTPQQMDQLYRQRSWQRLTTAPWPIAKFFAVNSAKLLLPHSPPQGYKSALQPRFWSKTGWRERFAYLSALSQTLIEFLMTVMCLLFVGLGLERRFRPTLTPLSAAFMAASVALIFYWWLAHANANAGWRFLLPLHPFLLAAAASTTFIRRHYFQQRREGATA